MTTVGFLITNNGEHSAATWAEFTAKTIADLIQISDTAAPEVADQARRTKLELQLKLFDIFNAHHGKVMDSERAELKKDKHRISHMQVVGFDPRHHMPTTLEQVNAALAATPFATHFGQPQVQDVLKAIIGQHSADVMHHEHRYHQDRAAKAAKGA